jgi:CheY-like chemotaxis protein
MPHKLLLADDSVTIQRVIELTFADEDVQVLAVGDGQQAIARVQSDRPDIVLADVGMPERDGYEVADFIKHTPELAHIPVLLLTGAFEPIDESRAQAVGCDGVLVKPFEPQMVINRVKDLLAGRRPKNVPAATPESQAPAVAGQAPAPERGVPVGSPQPAALSGSLEDYFDRLDAAFASLDTGAPPAGIEAAPQADAPPAARSAAGAAFLSADDLAGWDPDLSGDPEPPAAVAQPAAAAGSPQPVTAAAPPPRATAQPAAVAVPSLAEAFAALLTAEQAQPVAPSRVRPGMLSDDVVEDLVRRVTDRINDRAVRDTVVEVAERLVREEIRRIKGA